MTAKAHTPDRACLCSSASDANDIVYNSVNGVKGQENHEGGCMPIMHLMPATFMCSIAKNPAGQKEKICAKCKGEWAHQAMGSL